MSLPFRDKTASAGWTTRSISPNGRPDEAASCVCPPTAANPKSWSSRRTTSGSTSPDYFPTGVRSCSPRGGLVSRILSSWRIPWTRGSAGVLVDGGSDAHYLSFGHLVYRVGSTLQGVRFDLPALEVVGGATTVIEGVAPVVGGGDRGGAQFAVSESGSLFYLSGGLADSSLVWVDRQGEREPLALPPGLYRGARISPDGTSLATLRDDDIWLYDITRGAMSRLTFTADNSFAFWTPDGKAIVFASQRNGTGHVFWQPADGSGEAEQLTTGDLDRHPEAISPDGSVIAFHEHYPDYTTDLWVLEMDGDRETRLFLDTAFYERFAEVSPDGRWLAYVSDESGQAEVQRPFPDGGGKSIVSTDGGFQPRVVSGRSRAILSRRQAGHGGSRRARR